MISFYNQLSNILIASPGNLVYHLTLIFVLVICLQAVLSRNFNPQLAKQGRVMLTLALLLVLQIGLFLVSTFTWQGILDQHLYLPPMDRFVTTLSLILLVWIWNFPRNGRFVDIVTLLLSLVTVVLFIFTLSAWSTQSATAVFNSSWLDWGWSVFSIFILFSGVLVLLVQKPPAWGVGLFVFNIILLAFIAHMIWEISAGNFSPSVRIAQLIGFPLIPSLIYSLQKPAEEKTVGEKTPSPSIVLDQNWLSKTYQSESLNMVESLAHAISVDVNADTCVLIEAEGNEIHFLGGFNRIHNQTIGYRTIIEPNFVLLREIMRKGEIIVLQPKDEPETQFESIMAYLGLSPTSQEEICFAPLGKRSSKEYWSVISLSEGKIGIEDRFKHCLQDFEKPALLIFQHFEAQKNLEFKVTELEVTLAQTRSDLESMTSRKNLLERQINDLIADDSDLDALSTLHNELVNLSSAIANSKDGQRYAAKMESGDETALQRIAQLEVLLDQAHAETSFLKDKLTQASQKMFSLQEKLVKSRKISQEYSTEKQAIHDIDMKRASVNSSFMDMNQVIDRVIEHVSMMLLEKELNLKLAIPDTLPAIHMEETIFVQLLERGFNFLAKRTDTRGSLLFRTEVPAQSEYISLLIAQQSKTGTEEPGLREKTYTHEKVPPQSETESSDDFKIMKEIALSQGGRAWIDSEQQNMTIHVDLPLEAASYHN
jgi:hypothetical protein